MLTTISRVVLFTIFISVITGKILEGWERMCVTVSNFQSLKNDSHYRSSIDRYTCQSDFG